LRSRAGFFVKIRTTFPETESEDVLDAAADFMLDSDFADGLGWERNE